VIWIRAVQGLGDGGLGDGDEEALKVLAALQKYGLLEVLDVGGDLALRADLQPLVELLLDQLLQTEVLLVSFIKWRTRTGASRSGWRPPFLQREP